MVLVEYVKMLNNDLGVMKSRIDDYVLLRNKYFKFVKKLPYNDYKFHLPYDFDYVTFWFYRYYNLNGYYVIWGD